MNEIDDNTASLAEYHARQRANIAVNKAAGTDRALSDARSKVRSVRARLEKALELLGEATDSAARQEIEAAITELKRIGV